MRVAALYLQGKTQTEIARVVGVSQMTVSNDLAALRKEWLAASLRDYDAKLAEEWERLKHLERAAWEEWERSREHGLGDTKYLNIVRRCIEIRLEITGAYDRPPTTVNVNQIILDTSKPMLPPIVPENAPAKKHAEIQQGGPPPETDAETDGERDLSPEELDELRDRVQDRLAGRKPKPAPQRKPVTRRDED